MDEFRPLSMGTTGTVQKATRVVGGLEVIVVEKTAKSRRSYIDRYDTEMQFLKLATEKGVKGVPKFYGYDNAAVPEIVMEWIEGEQFLDLREYSTSSPGHLNLPDDLELQLKIPALYVLTMDHVIRSIGMVKATDNKALDIIVVNRKLREVGDLVIVDWGHAEKATGSAVHRFLAESFDLVGHAPKEVNPSGGESVSMYYDMSAYYGLLGKSDNQRLVAAEIERSQPELDRLKSGIEDWLREAPETPYKRIVQNMFALGYSSDLKGFVRDLIDFYRWRDEVKSAPELDRRERIYEEILGWIGDKPARNISAASTLTSQPEGVSKPSLEIPVAEEVPEGYIDGIVAAERYKISLGRLRDWGRTNRIKSTMIQIGEGSIFYVAEASVVEEAQTQAENAGGNMLRPTKGVPIAVDLPKGYEPLDVISNTTGRSPKEIMQWVKDREIEQPIQVALREGYKICLNEKAVIRKASAETS